MEGIDAEKFYARLERIQTEWLSHKNEQWSGADVLSIFYGSRAEELLYSKFSSFHIYLFGYEFPDSVILITRNELYFMATAKKCNLLEPLIGKSSKFQIHLLQRTKDEGQNRELMHTLAHAIRKSGGVNVGGLYKAEYLGTFIPSWFDFLADQQFEKVEIAAALGNLLAKKDETELVSSTAAIFV
jgi:nucleosome binding factor SPN SPT16 subunit